MKGQRSQDGRNQEKFEHFPNASELAAILDLHDCEVKGEADLIIRQQKSVFSTNQFASVYFVQFYFITNPLKAVPPFKKRERL